MPWLLLLALGCGPDAPTDKAPAGTDSGPSTTDSTGTSDSGTSTTDSGTTGTTTDGTIVPDPECGYLETTAVVQSCGGNWTTLWTYAAYPADPECPDYVGSDGRAWTDLEAARRALACDDTCVYVPNTAVMVLYCDTRGEYTDYRDGGPGQTAATGTCPALQYWETVAGSGWYDSAEAYAAEHPCP